jgi:hypothetical protein
MNHLQSLFGAFAHTSKALTASQQRLAQLSIKLQSVQKEMGVPPHRSAASCAGALSAAELSLFRTADAAQRYVQCTEQWVAAYGSGAREWNHHTALWWTWLDSVAAQELAELKAAPPAATTTATAVTPSAAAIASPSDALTFTARRSGAPRSHLRMSTAGVASPAAAAATGLHTSAVQRWLYARRTPSLVPSSAAALTLSKARPTDSSAEHVVAAVEALRVLTTAPVAVLDAHCTVDTPPNQSTATVSATNSGENPSAASSPAAAAAPPPAVASISQRRAAAAQRYGLLFLVHLLLPFAEHVRSCLSPVVYVVWLTSGQRIASGRRPCNTHTRRRFKPTTSSATDRDRDASLPFPFFFLPSSLLLKVLPFQSKEHRFFRCLFYVSP